MYNKKYMLLALKKAEIASKRGEVPIGAVLVKDDKIICSAYNLKESKKSSLEHAEVRVIRKANKKLSNWRLDGCDLYVTLEPCPMCASLIHQSRIDNVYYCLDKNDDNNFNVIKSIFVDKYSNKVTNLELVDCGKKSFELLNKFFSSRRH